VGAAEDAHPPTERMMAMLATFAYVRVLILWSYWLFSKVAKVANISTGVKVATFCMLYARRITNGSLFNIAHFVYSDTGTIPHCAWGCGAPYSYAWASWIEACPGSCL
jgi:hypothetical protein